MEAKSEVSSPPKNRTKSTSLMTSFLAGALSGACSTVLLQPFDLIKTRIQQSPQSSVWAQTKLVARSEGLLGFWTGVTPSLWRTVPGIGLHFASYHALTGLLSEAGQHQLSPLQSLAVGGLARVIAGTVLMPVSVIKPRWEAGGPQFGYKGAGMVGAVKTILRLEGGRGLVAGLVPTILRDAPYSALYLMFYNKLKALTAAGQPSDSLRHFSCGLLAGALATVLVQPADVVKTELQLRQERLGRLGHWRTVRQIFSLRGVGGFFVGLGPRVVRKSLMSALAWSVYERATHQIFTKS